MDEHWLTKNIIWKSRTFRSRGRPKMRWEDDIKHNLKVTKIYHWKKQVKSRNEWKQITDQTNLITSCSAQEEEEEE
jgi:hypothetical protein